ncbi:MAG: hypothetical protein ACAI38_06150 [Myxococcota bacterium]
MPQVAPAQPRYVQAPPVPAYEPHGIANFFQGLAGAFLGLGMFGLGFAGIGITAIIAGDAALDYLTGRGLAGWFGKFLGWESLSNQRSIAASLAEAWSPSPRRAGYQMRPPAYS